MRFGKRIRYEAGLMEEYGQKLMAYKRLKKCIRALVQKRTMFLEREFGNTDLLNPEVLASLMLKSDEETEFFRVANAELKQVNQFYVKREEEHTKRFQSLEAKVHGMLSSEYQNRQAVIVLKDAVLEYRHELGLLKKYISLNHTGFSKILKKHDKKTGVVTKLKYIKTVETKPFYRCRSSVQCLLDAADTLYRKLRQTDAMDARAAPVNGMAQKLYMMVAMNDAEGTRNLLENERSMSMSDANVVGFDTTPLHKAAAEGHLECMQILLGKDADVNERDVRDTTPLHHAAQAAQLSCVHVLLIKGAEPNATDCFQQTALHKACVRGNAEVVRHLLEHGADVALADVDGSTSLHKACANGHTACSQLLLEHSEGGSVSSAPKSGMAVDETAEFTRRRAMLDRRSLNGKTPLQWATINGHLGCVSYLLSCGARVNATDESGRSALHDAASTGSTACLTLLIARGGLVSMHDDKDRTPLHYAAAKGHVAAAVLLVNRKADLNAQSSSGRTALHESAAKGYGDMCSLFLSHGADTTLKDRQGLTPHDEAVYKGALHIASLLACKKRMSQPKHLKQQQQQQQRQSPLVQANNASKGSPAEVTQPSVPPITKPRSRSRLGSTSSTGADLHQKKATPPTSRKRGSACPPVKTENASAKAITGLDVEELDELEQSLIDRLKAVQNAKKRRVTNALTAGLDRMD
eukprot:TRINITY_DN1121_c0_g1_i1.p1 TRINITY_DN1121_c0_g1~~TRINITY_DN1121_c0_g1_i1.p1  ORF type:complete len:694 (+),score=171.48 TRINITY_DN1121_c0_g1_i1:414-2495(+)